MRTVLVYFGWLLVMGLIVLGLMASCSPAHAAGNAADVRGRFVLVLGGTAHNTKASCNPFLDRDDVTSCMNTPWTHYEMRVQPVVVGVFDSFKLCTGAGRELQARLNTDGYTLDFACVAEGR